MPVLIDLRGMRFGRLVVTRRVSGANSRPRWECFCDCGQECHVDGRSLRGGRQRSCGCLRREASSSAQTTHGLSKSAEFKAWCAIKQRCGNPKTRNFHCYGGRGITVCDRWLHSFETFLEDMGPRPSPKHSIDRRDNDGPYAPGNCRWATRVQQNRNKRNNRRVTIGGETLTVIEWCERSGLQSHVIRNRLRLRWPAESLLLPAKIIRLDRRGKYTKDQHSYP